MAEPIMTAAELISFLEGQCKQSDSDRDDWKLMTERLQRVIKHHENVGAELRASIAQLETHNAALSGGWKALECELAESSRVLKQANSALNSQQNESRRLEAENQRLQATLVALRDVGPSTSAYVDAVLKSSKPLEG